MAHLSSCWAAAGLLMVIASLSQGGKLLVVPQDWSHWLSMRPVVEELVKRGHKISLVIPESFSLIEVSCNYTVKTFSMPFTKEQVESEIKIISQHIFVKESFLAHIHSLYRQLSFFTETVLSVCKQLLGDRDLIRYLKEGHFDAVLIDAVSPCGQIVAEHLSIPSIYYTRLIPCDKYDATRCPNPTSYVPFLFTSYTEHMEFSQRVKNLGAKFINLWLCYVSYSPLEHLASEFLQRGVTIHDLFGRASVWLVRYDFVFEFPHPIMPNMVFIGGITCAVGKPLSQEFEKLVNDSGEHGIVVFSLGSMVSEIPMKNAMAIAEAFGTIPQTVLWRYTGPAPSNLAANTKLIKWLPQNDLLAHPKTRAFITHAGSHGIYEGICNAVPMVLLPLLGDQMDNAVRIESRGAGVTLNVLEMTAQDLSKALKAVINDPSYKGNITRLSQLHLDRPIHPLDLAVHWVEFVMRHKGAPHLRPAAHDLNWVQYHSLDVIAFLLAVVFGSLFIGLKCCCFCGRKCCGRKKRPQKTKSH